LAHAYFTGRVGWTIPIVAAGAKSQRTSFHTRAVKSSPVGTRKAPRLRAAVVIANKHSVPIAALRSSRARISLASAVVAKLLGSAVHIVGAVGMIGTRWSGKSARRATIAKKSAGLVVTDAAIGARIFSSAFVDINFAKVSYKSRSRSAVTGEIPVSVHAGAAVMAQARCCAVVNGITAGRSNEVAAGVTVAGKRGNTVVTNAIVLTGIGVAIVAVQVARVPVAHVAFTANTARRAVGLQTIGRRVAQ
jgi:hypothetical protein